jgi:hypothetical protein
LNRYLNRAYNADLNLIYIDPFSSKEVRSLSDFSWKLFELQEQDTLYRVFTKVRNILQLGNNSYQNASEFLASLSEQYFEAAKENDKHTLFFNNVIAFIDFFGRGDGQQYKWLTQFKTELAKKLIEKKAKVIPNVILSASSETLYRKKADIIIQLPDFLGISITDFEIKDSDFKKALNVSDFSEYNDVLKYFKQCSFHGDCSKNKLSENQQKSLLSALVQIFKAKQYSEDYLASHRFTKALTAKLRGENYPLNQANFNISTVFLKTKTGLYKPAQICKKNELDLTFLPNDLVNKQLDNFLKFIGVSLNQDYIFSDVRIYNELAQGLTYIPVLAKIEALDKNDKIDSSLIECLYIINSKGKKTHPALVNEQYKFLESIRGQELKPELDNLWVKKYNQFASEYLDVLKRHMQDFSHREEIIRFYQNLFQAFCREKYYLLIEDGLLKWGNQNTNFSVLLDKTDFELARRFKKQKFLCYYSGDEAKSDPILKSKIVEVQRGNIEYDTQHATENAELKQKVMSKMEYILLEISKFKKSEINYLSDENTAIETLQKKCQKWRIKETSFLRQEIVFGKLGKLSISKLYCYEEDTLFFKMDNSNQEKAQGICEYLFHNRIMTNTVELIVFYKDAETLKNEQHKWELDWMIKRWKPNYAKKFEKFSKQILESFVTLNDFEDKWFCFNEKFKSTVLMEIDKAGKLQQLKVQIAEVKNLEEYVGYFDDFELEIDYTLNLSLIAKALGYLKSTKKPEAIITYYTNELDKWASKLEGEAPIRNCLQEIEKRYRDFRVFDNPEVAQKEAQEWKSNMQIDSIHEQIQLSTAKKITHLSNMGEVRIENIPIISDKTIYQNNESLSSNSTITGSDGEIEVLGDCIREFLKLNTEDRKKGIQSIFNVLCEKIKQDAHTTLKNRQDQCLAVIREDSQLEKALIPLLYVTMHYKYAFFDIITYKYGKPTFIEVKTTKSDSKSFFMSLSELEFARSEKNYEIVRVTPSERINIGNPIMDFESKFQSIRSDNYEIMPVKYKLSFL